MSSNIAFPPERKQRKQHFHGVLLFQMSVLSRHPELLNEVLGLHQAHNAIELEDRKNDFVELENEADMFIQGAQDAKRVLETMNAEHFEANKRYEQKADVLRSALHALEQYQSKLEGRDDGEPLTRKQERERQAKLQSYEDNVGKARLAETDALTDLRRAIERMNEAAKAHAAWLYVAHQMKGELKNLEQAA